MLRVAPTSAPGLLVKNRSWAKQEYRKQLDRGGIDSKISGLMLGRRKRELAYVLQTRVPDAV